jgi:hypothetical protein
MGLGAAILHCQYTEINIKYMGLDAAIFPCPYAVIRDNHIGLGLSHSSLSMCRNQG